MRQATGNLVMGVHPFSCMSACNVATLTGRFSWGFYYHLSTRADFYQNRSDLCTVSLKTLLLYTLTLFTGIYCVRYLKRETGCLAKTGGDVSSE